jgi:chorismate lyase/3-hydroxybenzoate synthase
MDSGHKNPLLTTLSRHAPRVSYRDRAASQVLDADDVLAVFGFGHRGAATPDPRWLRVPLEPLQDAAPVEVWQVDAPVSSGHHGALQWSAGGGWLFAAIDVDEREHGGPERAAAHAYACLCAFLRSRPERHVLRVWNYQAAINQGEGDAERYKLFCGGRAQGMGAFFADVFPAASALGHHDQPHQLQVYLLACDQAGTSMENPRQVSAWRYPRQYGPASPRFARATILPAHDALAISGTAAVVGHSSAHQDDLLAQTEEILVNLDSLLASTHMPAGFDAHSPLKVYVRHAEDAAPVHALLEQRLPGVPLLMLQADICRRELLVEVDGWRYR